MARPSSTTSKDHQMDSWNISIVGKHLSVKNLKLVAIPRMCVITGLNGSGKSHLIQAISIGASNLPSYRAYIDHRNAIQKERDAQVDLINERIKIINDHREAGNHTNEPYLDALRRDIENFQQNIDRFDRELLAGHEEPVCVVTHDTLPAGQPFLFPLRTVLVDDAFQSLKSKGVASTSLTEAAINELRENFGDEFGNRNIPFTSLPRLLQEKLEKRDSVSREEILNVIDSNPGLAVNVTSPLAGLELVMVKYRLRSFYYHENHGVNKEEARTALGTPPWEALSQALAVAGFPYSVVSPDGLPLEQPFHIKFEGPSGIVDPHTLSSGEKTLAGIVCSLYSGNHGGALPDLLLLDEPDAHLHPSLCANVLNAINDVIVNQLGVRVILTTHSPSTVALAPEGSVYKLEKLTTGEQALVPVDNWTATRLLTSGLISVGPNSNNVFVEDKDDVTFYNTVLEILELSPEQKFPAGMLGFHPANKDKHGKDKGDGGWRKVVEWVKDLNSYTVWGIIDLDQGDEIPDAPDRLKRIQRYSIENYLIDPINWTVYLSRLNSTAVPSSFVSFHGMESSFRIASSEEYQSVIDEVCDRVKATMLADAIPEADLDSSPLRITYIQGQVVNIPSWLASFRGKDLFKYFGAAFGIHPNLNSLIGTYRIVKNFPNDLKETLHSVTGV